MSLMMAVEVTSVPSAMLGTQASLSMWETTMQQVNSRRQGSRGGQLGAGGHTCLGSD